MEVVIVGGSDAGITAALRVRELSEEHTIHVYLGDEFPNFSICGLPFFLSGETPDWRQLAHRTEFPGINIHRNHWVTGIRPHEHRIEVEHRGKTESKHYDRLLIATGAEPRRPPINGIDQDGVFVLHTMEDSFLMARALTERQVTDAIIIGAGYIGLEMVDALVHRGIKVTVMERFRSPLPTVDSELGEFVGQMLQDKGVQVQCGATVESIVASESGLRVTTTSGLEVTGQLVLVAAGVEPNAKVAAAAGVETGEYGAIRADRQMRTNVPDIFAAGDCIETWHRVLERFIYLPLGTTAHKQGRVAGENMLGGNAEYAGSLGTQVVKIFDLAVSRTGLREDEARKAGFDPLTTHSEVWDHKAYYPGANKLRIRMTGDRSTGRLLGAQIAGHWKSEVSKRVDIFASALFHRMKVEELLDLDLSYTPPLSAPWDPVQQAAQDWLHAFRTRC